MPMDKYKSFFEIVKMLCQINDWTKLRLIEKELRILLKVKSKITSKKRKKKRTAKQREATKKLIALNKRRNR